MVPSFPTNLGMIVNMADGFCTRLSQNHEDLRLLSPSESGVKFEKKNRGGGLEAGTSGERCIQLRIVRVKIPVRLYMMLFWNAGSSMKWFSLHVARLSGLAACYWMFFFISLSIREFDVSDCNGQCMCQDGRLYFCSEAVWINTPQATTDNLNTLKSSAREFLSVLSRSFLKSAQNGDNLYITEFCDVQ